MMPFEIPQVSRTIVTSTVHKSMPEVGLHWQYSLTISDLHMAVGQIW